jgi:hypothetical protein
VPISQGDVTLREKDTLNSVLLVEMPSNYSLVGKAALDAVAKDAESYISPPIARVTMEMHS